MTIRPMILAVALLALPAAAQTQDCVAAGLLSVDSFSFGTQRIPRDPRNPASSDGQRTASAAIRNPTGQSVTFGASFEAPPVQAEFVSGRRWTLGAGGRTTIMLGNVYPPAANDAAARRTLRLTCG